MKFYSENYPQLTQFTSVGVVRFTDGCFESDDDGVITELQRVGGDAGITWVVEPEPKKRGK